MLTAACIAQVITHAMHIYAHAAFVCCAFMPTYALNCKCCAYSALLCIANACHTLLHGDYLTTSVDVVRITMFHDVDFPF